MSWLYSRVLVEEYLEANSLDGEQFAPLSGNPIPQAYCALDKMTDFSRLSRFGMMFKPLTDILVDVVSGGFPCQDISAAGKGAGIDGERSGMWREMARIICEVRSRYVFVENSPMLTSRGLGTVLGDLATMGFDARWGVLGAADIGANHQRDRIWIVGKQMAYANSPQLQRNQCPERKAQKYPYACSSSWWEVEPSVDRVADGMADRVDRLKAIGNGQVPLCAATAWSILSE